MKNNTEKQQKYEKAKQQIGELEAYIKKYEQENDNIIANAETQVKKICEKNNLFCGIVLTKELLLQLIDMALTTDENILVPFKIYFKTNNNGTK